MNFPSPYPPAIVDQIAALLNQLARLLILGPHKYVDDGTGTNACNLCGYDLSLHQKAKSS